MEIASDPYLGRIAGTFTAGMAVLQFILGIFVFPKILVLCIATGVAFLLLSAVCFSYRHVVHVDQQNDVLEQHRSILFVERNRGFLFSSFYSVGVTVMAGGGGFRPLPLAYMVEVRGRTRLILPGVHAGLDQAMAKAAKFAAIFNLPLDSRVRRIFLDR